MPKIQVGASDGHKVDGKNQQEVIHWHNRYIFDWAQVIFYFGECFGFSYIITLTGLLLISLLISFSSDLFHRFIFFVSY